MTKVGARVVCKVNWKSSRKLVGEVVPGSMRMEVSNVFERSQENLDAILIHELCHVYYFHIGDINEGHGYKFQALAKKLGAIVGFEIPLTDDVSHLAMTNDVSKPVGVMLIKRPGKYTFRLISDKVIGNTDIKEYGQKLVDIKFCQEASGYIINTKVWTKFTVGLPVSRKIVKNSYVMDQDMIENLLPDLLENGKLIWEFKT